MSIYINKTILLDSYWLSIHLIDLKIHKKINHAWMQHSLNSLQKMYKLQVLYFYKSLCARQNDVNAHIILPGSHRSAKHMRITFDTCFTLSLIYHLYVLFVWISYQARFGLKISYPAIVFIMVIGLLNCGSFIVHILLLGTSKVFTLSVFLPCACVHVLLPGTRRNGCIIVFLICSCTV